MKTKIEEKDNAMNRKIERKEVGRKEKGKKKKIIDIKY